MEEPAAAGAVGDRSVVGDDQPCQEDAEVIDEMAALGHGIKVVRIFFLLASVNTSRRHSLPLQSIDGRTHQYRFWGADARTRKKKSGRRGRNISLARLSRKLRSMGKDSVGKIYTLNPWGFL